MSCAEIVWCFRGKKDIIHSNHQTKANVYCFSANAFFRIFLNSCQNYPRLFLRRFWIPRFRHSRSVGVTRYASIGDLFRFFFRSKGSWAEREKKAVWRFSVKEWRNRFKSCHRLMRRHSFRNAKLIFFHKK